MSLFDTSEWATYAEEEPNALAPDEVPQFMAKARDRFVEKIAAAVLGVLEIDPIRTLGAAHAGIRGEQSRQRDGEDARNQARPS